MPTLHIDVYEHAGFVTVSEMRRMIAQAVSKLKGDSLVTYSFDYRYAAPTLYSNHTGNLLTSPVSEMRQGLARHLSNLNGNDSVSFSFHCRVAVN